MICGNLLAIFQCIQLVFISNIYSTYAGYYFISSLCILALYLTTFIKTRVNASIVFLLGDNTYSHTDFTNAIWKS